jgi:hypothetical protein
MLPFAKNNLRGARNRAFLFLFVLHQIGTSHCVLAPALLLPIDPEERA